MALQHGANNPIVVDDKEDRGEEIGLVVDEMAEGEFRGFVLHFQLLIFIFPLRRPRTSRSPRTSHPTTKS